jgi:outer membrane protein assembly factor BamB
MRGTSLAFRRSSLTLVVLAACLPSPVRADDWPQWLGPQRDGVWRETGILERFPPQGATIRWRTPIGGGYAGPAVADGRVYVTDRQLAGNARNPANPFAQDAVAGKERVLCLDEATGKIVWAHEYDSTYELSYPAGPRTTPVIQGGKVYTLGAMGHLLCLDAGTGKVIWSKYFPEDYGARVPVWGYAAHPLVDGERLICLVGGKAGLVVAFHKDTGKELWHALTARDQGYCPPMIYQVGATRQLIIWHPEGVNALDPQNGAVLWSIPWKLHSSAMSISTPRFVDGLLFLTSFYNGSMMLKLDQEKPAASILWKSKTWKAPPGSEQSNHTDILHSIISTPFIKDGIIYGVCSYGQLRAIRAATGERLWETFAATGGKETRWANAFLVPQGDRFFLFNEKGNLIIARLTPQAYEEIGRAHILEPTYALTMAPRLVVWSHPAFANRCMFARNDKEIVCVSLAAPGESGK